MSALRPFRSPRPLTATAAGMLVGAGLVLAGPGGDADRFVWVLQQMHQAHRVQVELGELARDRGQNRGVRAYAKRAVRDHRVGDRRVRDVARRLGVELDETREPVSVEGPEPDPGRRATRARSPVAEGDPTPQIERQRQIVQQMGETRRKLEHAPPDKFDRHYLTAMVQTNEKLIGSLRTARGQVESRELRAWLEEIIPILDQHRELALSLLDSLDGRG